MTGRADDQDELVSILKKVTAKPVTIVDARAHLDGVLRTALQATRFFNLAKQLNIGITVTMFPLDDVDVMTNLDELCQFCGSQVEYIVVKNPARAARTKMFDGSPLDDELKALGAATITLPLLSEIVKMNLAFLETKHERGIPFNEAIGSDELGLDIMARGMLQDWTGQMFNQYDRIAGRLLPTAEPGTSGSSRLSGTKAGYSPRRDTKTLLPVRPRKAFSCRGPWPDYFQFSTRAPSCPRAPFRIANRPALEKAAPPRHPIPLTRNLRIAQFRGGADDGRRRRAIIQP
jgi:hypothetical protein